MCKCSNLKIYDTNEQMCKCENQQIEYNLIVFNLHIFLIFYFAK